MENPSKKNPIVKITQVCEGNRWAIGDIHGCPKTFQHLVQNQIQLKKEDHLYLLGDYVNRGPDSGGIIDFILELQNQGYQVFALKGNHESIILTTFEGHKSE